jgi:hypothetical protein
MVETKRQQVGMGSKMIARSPGRVMGQDSAYRNKENKK